VDYDNVELLQSQVSKERFDEAKKDYFEVHLWLKGSRISSLSVVRWEQKIGEKLFRQDVGLDFYAGTRDHFWLWLQRS
jgi:hypothetical protein